MRKSIALILAAAALAAAPAAKAEEIAISCGALGQELALCREGAEAWAAKTGNTVKVISTPNDSNDRLALYQQLLAAGAADIDVFQIDVIWPGILGAHFIDLLPFAKGAEKQHFPALIANDTIAGRLVAMPWFGDAGLLYYRKDLLEKHGMAPPATWQELAATARAIQDAERQAGDGKIWGFVFQGKAYEGLTCNALEWIDAHRGGAIVDESGDITVDNPQAAAALREAASWIGAIAPPGVLGYAEEEARGVFQSGHAVFMRNWPYAWALANDADSPVRGKVGVTTLPRGGESGKVTGALGGWQLAVSRYSRSPERAADLVLYLTSREEQKRRAIRGSFNPTIASLYEDKEVLAAAPFLGALHATLTDAVARPSRVTGARYNKVSNAFWNAVHDILSGQAAPEAALAALAGELKLVKRSGW